MRSCNPVFVGTRAAGIRHQACTAPRRARRKVLANPQAPSHADPRSATLHECAKLRPKRFFSLDRARPISLLARSKEKWGVHCPAILMAVYTVAALRFPSPGGAANRAASSKPPCFIRRWRRFGDFPRPMGRLPKKGQGGQAPFSRNLLTASPAPAAPAPCRAGPTG